MKKILFATTNPAKLSNYKEILKTEGIELLTLADLNLNLHVEETGRDALENAYIKAKAYFLATGLPTIGMDNNLFIEGIADDKQPGCYVRRVNGKELTDDEMIDYYTKLVKDNGGKLLAKWVYGMVLVTDKDLYKHSWSYENFYLVDTPSEIRNPGYPLDSISVNPINNKYIVELTLEEQKERNIRKSSDGVIEFILSSMKEEVCEK